MTPALTAKEETGTQEKEFLTHGLEYKKPKRLCNSPWKELFRFHVIPHQKYWKHYKLC